MIDIILHIEYLIRRHDCVILPGVGAFVASYKSSYINDEWGIMTPPKREICFNPAIINNDGLLANSIARRNRLSFESANKQMLQAIADMKATLTHDKELSIGRVGNFYLGEEDKICFKSFRSGNQFDEFWGLQAIKIPTLEQLEYVDSEGGSRQKKFRSDENYYIPVSKRFVRYAAMFILVFVATISLSLPTNNSETKQNYASVVPITAKMVTNLMTSSVQEDVNSDVVEDFSEEMDNEVVSVAEKDCYYLIVASLSTEFEARKFIESADAEDELKIVSTSSMNRVFAAQDFEMQNLIKIMQTPEFKQKYSEAWIWRAKH